MSQSSLRILLAEGAPGEAAASLRLLYPESEGQLELTIVGSTATLLPTIHVVAPEIILFDLSLAKPEPLEMVRCVHRAAPEVPLIVLADESESKVAAASVRGGAQGYLLKGSMDPRTIDRVLRAALERNTVEGLADLLRDPVTGLHTRDGLHTLGTQALEYARQKSSSMVVVCARIENLPAIQAEFGGSAAENALKEISKLLISSFRRTDLIARTGDAQFAIVAVDAIEPSGPVLRQRLEKRLEALNHDAGPWGPLGLRISVGFCPASDVCSFGDILDGVELGLRSTVTA
jgi:diguanylate cyclase (GGDEF)-like protein